MPSPFTKPSGPLRFPSQAGKLVRAGPILNGTQRVYWGLGFQNTRGDAFPFYFAPTGWPKVGALILVPKAVQFRIDYATFPGGLFGEPITTAGRSLTSLIRSTNGAGQKYYNVDVNATPDLSSILPPPNDSPFLGMGNGLDAALPLATDVTSGDFLATDAIILAFENHNALHYATFSSFDPHTLFSTFVPNTAAIQAAADRITSSAAWYNHFHMKVYLYDAPGQPPIHNNAPALNEEVFGDIFPGLLDPSIYSYGGVVASNDPSFGAYQDDIDTFYGLM